jgi:hypothetical protein
MNLLLQAALFSFRLGKLCCCNLCAAVNLLLQAVLYTLRLGAASYVLHRKCPY